jgi:thiol-disulfide isomerase/thioredoxin
MSAFRASVGVVWLLNAVLACGCSNSGPKPSTPTVANPPDANGQTQRADRAQTAASPSSSQAQTPPGQNPRDATSSSVDAADSTNKDAKELVAQINEMQSKSPQRTRAAFVEHFGNIVNLCDRALLAKLDPAERDQVREAAVKAIGMLSSADPKRRDLLSKVDKLADEALADTANAPLAATALYNRALTHLNIERDGSENDPAINKRLFAMAKEFAEKAGTDERAGQLLYMIGENAMMDGQSDTALEVLKYTIEIDHQGQFGKMAEGKLALLDAIGKPPEIAGPTLAGSEIDISDFKGKVVLVDFWATWCGPCVAELPNVRSVYDKYHDQGFEVIAVSFDQTKDELAKFVADQKLPWPQIFFDEEGKRFWQNPLGRKYGIDGIPATFLVDREGNLQKIGVRGEALEPAVVDMLKGAKSPLAN